MSNQSATDNYQGVWDTRIGFGHSPALLVVDFMKGYVTEGAPLYAPGVVRALAHGERLLDTARTAGVPIIHTNIRYHGDDCIDGGLWVHKAPVMKAMIEGHHDAQFCDEVQPHANELVITKQYASAFFATSLASTLHAQGIDTLILTGCSTSGCIRATAVDGVQHGFRVMVVREAVGDRHEAPHEANLFDIDSKYGDVISCQQAMDYLAQHTASG